MCVCVCVNRYMCMYLCEYKPVLKFSPHFPSLPQAAPNICHF